MENDKYDFQNYVLIEATAKTLYEKHHKEYPDKYPQQLFDELNDDTKDHYRTIAKYMVSRVEALIDIVSFYANENNWTALIENTHGDIIRVKDGIIFNDMGQKARDYLKDLGYIK